MLSRVCCRARKVYTSGKGKCDELVDAWECEGSARGTRRG